MTTPTPEPKEVMDVEADFIKKYQESIDMTRPLDWQLGEATIKFVTAFIKSRENALTQQNAVLLRELQQEAIKLYGLPNDNWPVMAIPASILEAKLKEITEEVI